MRRIFHLEIKSENSHKYYESLPDFSGMKPEIIIISAFIIFSLLAIGFSYFFDKHVR